MSRLSRLGVPALLLAAPLLFFHEVCLQGQAFLLRDLFNWFYPWRTFVAQSLARGDPPLWNPYSYAGTPFLANIQSGLLYPPNVVFWISDFPGGMRLFLVVQFALAAASMYWLLRGLACRVASALTGALAFAFGGWMVVHVEFPNKLAAASWLPLVVLGLVLWWRGRAAAGLAIGAAATACCITAGYPQTTFTAFLGAGVLWAAMAGERAWSRGILEALKFTVSLPAIAALGTLVAAAQVLPFLEAVGLSMRRFGMLDVLKLGLSPTHFLSLIYPHLFGLPGYSRYWGGDLLQFWLGDFYVGIPTLFLAAAAMAAGVRRPVKTQRGAQPAWRAMFWPAILLLALAAAFCMGERTPLAPFCLDWLPGFGSFKWLSTTSLLIAFPLCLLAAFGMEATLEAAPPERPLSRRSRILVIASAVVSACLVAIGVTAIAAPGPFETLARLLVAPVAFDTQLRFLAANLGPLRVDAAAAGAVAAVLAAAWLAVRAGRIRVGWLAGLIPFVLFADLKLASTGINYTTDPGIYSEIPHKVQQLLARPDPLFRILVTQETLREDLRMYGSVADGTFRWAANTQMYNLNLPHRLFSASDGDPLGTERWRIYQLALSGDEETEARGRLLAAANIGVILRGGRGKTESAEVPAYLPRVYLAAGARRMAPGLALEAMVRPDWDPYSEVLVENDFPGVPRSGLGPPVDQKVHRVTYTNNTVTIDVDASREAYMILADQIYPGWEATVDGMPTPIFTANYLFRGIDLPAGRHTVLFRYRPASVRWGIAGSIAGLAGLAAAVWADAARRRRRATAA